MGSLNINDIDKTKNKIIKDSKKGFIYFLKNVSLVILMIIAFYIVGNFSDLVENPKQALDLFLTNGWQIFCIMIFVVVGIYQLARNLTVEGDSEKSKEAVENYKKLEDEREKERDEEHKKAVDKRFENTPKIMNLLKDSIIDLGASRVSIAEMHNGTNNLNGLPFVFFDITYESVDHGVDYVSDEFKNFNMGKFPFISNHFFEGTYIGSIDSIKKEDPRLATILSLTDCKYMAATVLQGVNGPLGFLTITFNSDCDIPTKTEISQCLNRTSQQISTLLDK